MTLEHSRSLLLAEQATAHSRSELERRLESSVVAVSVDSTMPLATLTTRILLTTLRRGLGTLVLEPGDLSLGEVEHLEEAVATVDPARGLLVRGEGAVDVTVRVHVGSSASGRAIRIVPEGYGAHVAGARRAVITPARAANPLGAAYTAALGAAEVFKHTADVVSGRRILHRHLRFCPVTHSDDLGLAPDLTTQLILRLALVGVGAIGTGIAVILGELPATGFVLAVDRERFDRENVGTYSIGATADIETRPWKVELARRVLGRFDVADFRGPVAELPAEIDAGRIPWPAVVLTGLDSAGARREAQRIWPDRLIDGATGDTMVDLHDYGYGVDPCMICLFSENHDQPSGVERIASELGLPARLLADGERLLQEEDLHGLADEKRRRLQPQVGKPICGLVQALGLSGRDADGFMPSVPFVSLQAACLSVGRLLGHELGVGFGTNFIQYDALFGPQAASILRRERVADCYCSVRSTTIDAVRDRRATRKE